MALHAAAAAGNAAKVARLLAAGAAVDEPGARGMLPIHLAAEGGHSAVVQLLLAGGASPRAPDASGKLPIHIAAISGDAATVRQLIAAAPDTVSAARLPENSLPLHDATFAGNADTAAALIAAAPESVRLLPGGGRSPAFDIAVGMVNIRLLFGGPLPDAVAVLQLMMPHVMPDAALDSLPLLVSPALPFYTDLVLHHPLDAAQWQQVPSPCPGLGRALPTVLQRSQAEAARLVAHLPAADRAHLQAFALALQRRQRRLGVPLPAELANRILSLFDA